MGRRLTPDLNLPPDDQSSMIKYLHVGSRATTLGTWTKEGKIKQVKPGKKNENGHE